MNINTDLLNQATETVDHVVLQVSNDMKYISASYRTEEELHTHAEELDDFGIELCYTEYGGSLYKYSATYYIADRYE